MYSVSCYSPSKVHRRSTVLLLFKRLSPPFVTPQLYILILNLTQELKELSIDSFVECLRWHCYHDFQVALSLIMKVIIQNYYFHFHFHVHVKLL